MDIQLSYVVAGSGFPLVLLHGNGEDHSYFKRQFEPFAQHYRVIAPDTRGHGHTPRGTAPFTLDQFAEDLKGFLDGMDIGRCHLLGFSDGGNIALLFTLKYPEYVEKLVVNGANLFPAGLLPRERLHDAAVWTALQPARLLCPRARKKWELLDLMVTQPHIRPKPLSALPMPALVVAGSDDLILERHTRLIAEAIPNSRLLILPGDHCVARRNWQAFNPAVLDFLREEGPEWS